MILYLSGATCHEFQVGRLGMRVLKLKHYFKPYRMHGAWRFPRVVCFQWFEKEAS